MGGKRSNRLAREHLPLLQDTGEGTTLILRPRFGPGSARHCSSHAQHRITFLHVDPAPLVVWLPTEPALCLAHRCYPAGGRPVVCLSGGARPSTRPSSTVERQHAEQL